MSDGKRATTSATNEATSKYLQDNEWQENSKHILPPKIKREGAYVLHDNIKRAICEFLL